MGRIVRGTNSPWNEESGTYSPGTNRPGTNSPQTFNLHWGTMYNKMPFSLVVGQLRTEIDPD